MDKKIIKNYLYSNLYQLLLVVTPLITTPFLTRVMKSEVLSINSYTANIAQWFVLFGMLGINNYGSKMIGKYRDNHQDKSRMFIEIYCMQFISMLIISILYIVFLVSFDHLYKVIMMAQMITLLSVGFDITWFFYGIEDLKKITIRNSIVKIVGIVLIFSFIRSENDLLLFVLINSLSGLFGQLIMWLSISKHITFTKVKLQNILAHFKPNIALFIPQIAISVYSVLDITMLGSLYHDISHVNFYEQGNKLVKMFLFFVTSIGAIMLPRIANIHHKNDHMKIQEYLNNTYKLALYLAIPMVVGIITLIPNFISWFLPLEYQVVSNMIIALTPIIIFISISNVYGIQYMVPTGLVKQYTISVVVAAICNFAINLMLIPTYGAYGAIIGTVSSEFIVTIIQYIFIKNRIKLTINIKAMFNIILASISMGIIVILIGYIGSNIIINGIQVLVGFFIYTIILYILKDNFIMTILKGVKAKS